MLEEADRARSDWLVHTAETRANADRARHELSNRDAAAGADERLVSAEEWLAEHEADQRADDDDDGPVVDEHDLANVVEQREADVHTTTDADHLPTDVAEATAVVDIREATADEPAQDDTDIVRVPSSEEAADTVARAQRALVELDERGARDEHEAVEQTRAEELTRWHDEDTARAATADRQQADEAQRALVD